MSKMLRFVVIGCGTVATQYHLPAIGRSRRAQLVGVVDVDERWARDVGRRFGVVSSGADWRPVIGKIDAALIATPNALHADAVEQLVSSGVHVLCEKPLALQAAQARRLFDLAESLGVRLMAAHSRRFSPHLAFLRDLVHAGYLGEEGVLTASLGGPPGSWAARTDFRSRPASAGGGVMMDAGVHLVDLAVSVFSGAPKDIDYWEAISDTSELEEDAELTIDFASGGVARMALSSSHAISGSVTYRSGDDWVATSVNGPSAEFYIPSSRLCRSAGVLQYQPPAAGAYELQLEHFCDCAISDRPFLVTPDEVVRGLELIERCYARRQDTGGSDAAQ